MRRKLTRKKPWHEAKLTRIMKKDVARGKINANYEERRDMK